MASINQFNELLQLFFREAGVLRLIIEFLGSVELPALCNRIVLSLIAFDNLFR